MLKLKQKKKRICQLDPDGPMEKAVTERRLRNAVRADGRTSRATAGYFPCVGGRAEVVAFLVKCIVLKYTPFFVLGGVVSQLVGPAGVGVGGVWGWMGNYWLFPGQCIRNVARNIPYGRIDEQLHSTGPSPARPEAERAWGPDGARYAHRPSRIGKEAAIGRITAYLPDVSVSKGPHVFPDSEKLDRPIHPQSKKINLSSYKMLLGRWLGGWRPNFNVRIISFARFAVAKISDKS